MNISKITYSINNTILIITMIIIIVWRARGARAPGAARPAAPGYISVCVCMYVYIYIHIYIYIYIYVYVYIYIYIYIHTHSSLSLSLYIYIYIYVHSIMLH